MRLIFLLVQTLLLFFFESHCWAFGENHSPIPNETTYELKTRRMSVDWAALENIDLNDALSVHHCPPLSDREISEHLEHWQTGSRLHRKIAESLISGLKSPTSRLEFFVICRSDFLPVTIGTLHFSSTDTTDITLSNVISNPSLHIGGIRAAIKYSIKRGLLAGRSSLNLLAAKSSLNNLYTHLGFIRTYFPGMPNYFVMGPEQIRIQFPELSRFLN